MSKSARFSRQKRLKSALLRAEAGRSASESARDGNPTPRFHAASCPVCLAAVLWSMSTKNQSKRRPVEAATNKRFSGALLAALGPKALGKRAESGRKRALPKHRSANV